MLGKKCDECSILDFLFCITVHLGIPVQTIRTILEGEYAV